MSPPKLTPAGQRPRLDSHGPALTRSKFRRSAPTAAAIPVDRSALFGPPLVGPEKNDERYALHFARFTAELTPFGAIEDAWVWDITCLTWEAIQYRRLKQQLIVGGSRTALLARLGEDGTDPDEAKRLLEGWAAGNAGVIKEVEQILARVNSSLEEIATEAFLDQIDQIERLDRMIANVETRRNSIIREFDRRRAFLAQKICDEIEDAEFTELE